MHILAQLTSKLASGATSHVLNVSQRLFPPQVKLPERINGATPLLPLCGLHFMDLTSLLSTV